MYIYFQKILEKTHFYLNVIHIRKFLGIYFNYTYNEIVLKNKKRAVLSL